ncbi:MAG: SGNH/GDSL hydrolase family protein [Nitrospinae bacterium]|nr:SGNH/GDSL hydrolase family protein [Nitrospinota bacterium]
MSKPISHKKKKYSFAINISILISVVIFFMAVSEALFRIIARGKKPAREWSQKDVKLNSRGLRDYEYSLEKPEKVFRILVLGDSMTFGQGIEELGNTFPKKLEAYLNKGAEGVRFELINAAKPGWGTDNAMYYLYEKGFDFNPDMVLLNYYHNDVPTPGLYSCDSEDRDLVPSSWKGLHAFVNKMELYKLLKARVNRLLEKTGKKPSFEECTLRIYDSRGWEMEKIFIDAIHIACEIKNVKLMLSVVPVINKLGDEYPFSRPHNMLREYCEKRDIAFVDLFEPGFKGEKASSLWVSPEDWHLNEKGAEIAAQALFKRLEPLKQYKRLHAFSGAYATDELLLGKWFAPELDGGISRIEEGNGPLVYNKKGGPKEPGDLELKVWKDAGNYHFQRTIFNKNNKSVSTKVFDKKGKFLEYEKKDFDPETGEKKKWETIVFQDNAYLFSSGPRGFAGGPASGKEMETAGQRKYVFKYTQKSLGGDEGCYIEMEKDVPFRDPKVLENDLFPSPELMKAATKPTGLSKKDIAVFLRYGWAEYISQLMTAHKKFLLRNKKAMMR